MIKLDQKAHMLCPWIDETVRLPALLDPLEDLLGPDLLCWGTSLRLKEADGKTFAGWHQDTAYADVKPIVIICALALSPCTRESGCIRVIPGSHQWEILPHRENFGTDSLLTREQSIEANLDESQALDLELAPGEVAFLQQPPSVIPRAPTRPLTGVFCSLLKWCRPGLIKIFPENRRPW